MDLRPLRPSLFERVPPFINFVPALDPDEKPVYGPQYWDQREWDQDHFWKIPMAMANWIGWWATEAESDDRSRTSKRRNRRSLIFSSSGEFGETVEVMMPPASSSTADPFALPTMSSSFLDLHPGVKLATFPKMLQAGY